MGAYAKADRGDCFNPRPRVGGDCLCKEEKLRLSVSIHAPAWGATKDQ